MTNKEIKDFNSRINDYLDRRRLGDAFAELRNTAKALSSWAISDRIEKAEQGYSFMLRYLVDGAEDPSRETVYTELLREAAMIRDLLSREMAISDTPTLYYNTLRSVNSHRDETFVCLFDNHRKSIDEMSPFNNMALGSSPSESAKLRFEMNERDIFNRLWVTFPINVDDAKLAVNFIADESLPYRTRALSVSALTLGLLDFFDDRKFRILLDAYRSGEDHIAVRALVGIALVLDKYSEKYLSSDSINSLAALKETSGWKTDLKQVFVELIRTNDTRRISEKLNNEIFPEIKRMSQNMADRFKDMAVDPETLAPDGNPEWEEMLSDQKIRDNIKELGELQQEGADVFMTTFSSLKQFPFFNEVANWFMPYDPEHSVLSAFGSDASSLTDMIAVAPFICDSDKYSMALSLSMMPESQRSMMMNQLKAQQSEISEMLASADRGLRPINRKDEINNYVHSLYRFYHLFRRKGDFYNPFAHVANPLDIPTLEDSFRSEESLLSLGEFYFKIGLYHYARRIFLTIDNQSAPDSKRYQKLGFCCEKLGYLEAASSFYEQADLLEGSNIWNLKRLASVYRRLGQYSSAVSVMNRLSRLSPDDVNIAINLGRLYILNEDYKAAINQLRKAEFMDPDNLKCLRPLAWALLIDRSFDEARSYYERIIAEDPSADDLLNSGHLAWAMRQLGEAINYYRLSAERSSADKLIENIRSDSKYLSLAGIDTNEMPLIIDAIIYSLKQ